MLRRATAGDGPEIALLFRRARDTIGFLPTLHTPEEDRAFFGALVERCEAWVWDDGGRVLGFAVLGATTLDHLYVDAGAQGRGVGAALLEHAKARRPAGFDLWTFQRNEDARRFYARHGLREVERTDGSGNEEREPDVRLEWRPEPARPGGRGAQLGKSQPRGSRS